VIAVDVGNSVLQLAASRCAHLQNVQFHCLDVLNQLQCNPKSQQQQLVQIATAQQANVAFVDIGGDRAPWDVARVVQLLRKELQPSVLVVKSRKVFEAATHHSATMAMPSTDGSLADCGEFWSKLLNDSPN